VEYAEPAQQIWVPLLEVGVEVGAITVDPEDLIVTTTVMAGQVDRDLGTLRMEPLAAECLQKRAFKKLLDPPKSKMDLPT
jgi:hypothetical protein